jgi:hypothetical protein
MGVSGLAVSDVPTSLNQPAQPALRRVILFLAGGFLNCGPTGAALAGFQPASNQPSTSLPNQRNDGCTVIQPANQP